MPNTAPTTSYSITTAPLTAATTPNSLPWAIDGTLVAPNDAQADVGYQPYPSAPPIYSLENYARYLTSQWLERLSACGFFAQRATSRITITGTVTAGNTYTIDDGTNTDTYTATSADAAAGTPLLSVVTNWAQQLRSGDLATTLVGSVGGAGILDIIYRDPGTDWPAGTPTVTETGTNSIAIVDRYGGTAGQLSVMTAQAGSEAAACDLLHGTGTPDGAAAKLQFRKSTKNGAFRAGKWTGTQANLANVGAGSAAFGLDTTAVGATSFAAGDATTASGQDATAFGNGSTASGDQSLAIGDTTTASGQAAVALGTSTTASGDYSTATGLESIAAQTGERSLASGGFGSLVGTAQNSDLVVRTVTNGTPLAEQILDPDGGGTGPSLVLNNNTVYSIRVHAVGTYMSGVGGAAGDCAVFDAMIGAVVDNAGAVTLLGAYVMNLGAAYTGTDIAGGGYIGAPTFATGSGTGCLLWFTTVTNGLEIRMFPDILSTARTYRFVASVTATRVASTT